MNDARKSFRRMKMKVVGICCSTTFLFGFLGSCDNMLVGLTRYVEPCGTFLANCQPGDFQVNAASVGDFCVDPACTVPGACDDQQPLGTITNICP